LREAARDGEATTPEGYLVVCNDANEADPRFSIREPGGAWLSPAPQAPPAPPAPPPRLRYGQQCPGCLHPWWAHRTREPARQLAKPGPDHCIGQDCRCTRLGPAPGT